MKAYCVSRRHWTLAVLVGTLYGCAQAPLPPASLAQHSPHWQGRLAVKVLTPPERAFTANFELAGSPQAGQLSFTTPLGSTLAQLQWDATGAWLQTTGAPAHFESLDALTRHATGVALPIASLFSWLNGNETPTPGWEVNLQLLAEGRLSAKRLDQDGLAELKIILTP